MADEKLTDANAKYMAELQFRDECLQAKIIQNHDLIMELDEIKDAYRVLENNLSPEER